MIKNNGFTLAEVLITLAIIGVVATLTLPSLLSNVSEQQSMTAFRKIINTLNEAGQMNAAMEGFDFSITDVGTLDDSIERGDMTLAALFNERLQVSKSASGAYGRTGYCNKHAFVLRDGTAICPWRYDSSEQAWIIAVDTNGQKGPNLLSECTEEGCINKSGRQIKDQFIVTLYRSTAFPGRWHTDGQESIWNDSYASRYAMGIGKRANSGSGS